MRLLFVLEYFPPHIGGVETLFDNLTKRLVNKGFDVDIYTSLVEGSQRFEMSEGRRIFREPLPFRHLFPLRGFIPTARLARKADLIHTTSYSAAGCTALAGLFTKKPTVITIHEVWDKLWFELENPISASANYLLESAMCKIYKNSVITVPSEYTKRAILNKIAPAHPINVIPHGIDHSIFNTKVKPSYKFDFPTYMFHGRPGISKGLQYIFQAMPLIEKEVPDAKFLMMVSKRQRAAYRIMMHHAERLGVKDKIMFIEPRTNAKEVAGVIKSVDCCVIPSLSEGFCFAAVESQAVGTPVVASNAGSLPEVVRGGLFVKPRNAEDIAEKVSKILQNKKLRRKLGATGNKFVKKFTWNKAVNSYIKIYENV